jgi:hypothetical protein
MTTLNVLFALNSKSTLRGPQTTAGRPTNPRTAIPEAAQLNQTRAAGKAMRILSRVKPLIAVVVTLCGSWALVGAFSAPAFAAGAECFNGSNQPTGRCGPGFEINARTFPTNLAPGGHAIVAIDLYDIGALAPNGTITVTDTLPPGLTATEAGELQPGTEEGGGEGIGVGVRHANWSCSGTTVITCTHDPSAAFRLPNGGAGGGYAMQLGIAVNVAPGTSGTLPNRVTAAGGGAPTPASAVDPVTFSSTQARFGFTGSDAWFSNADGTLDTQAGSHPYTATVSFDLATEILAGAMQRAGGDVSDIESSLPPGLVGDPNAVSQCTRKQLDTFAQGGGGPGGDGCPGSSQIGVLRVWSNIFEYFFPVYNMVPPPGVPAEFAVDILGHSTFIDASVRTGGDYGITGHVKNIPQVSIEGSALTLWGYPADHTHDPWRNWNGLGGCGNKCEPVTGAVAKPFLTLPTACVGPLKFSIHANTWQDTKVTSDFSFLSHDTNGAPAGLTGCEHLNFNPAVSIAPDTSNADTPAGLTVEVKPPVGGLSDLNGLSTADIQNTTVTLPEGLVINPGQAAGLQACQAAQSGVGTESAASCPGASKVGTVSIKTPLLEGAAEKELEGNVYILQSNPPNLELLVAASADGVNLKLVGHVHLDESTGRLISTFSGTPELPFTNFKLSFSGGAQAALATPSTCGAYEATSNFTPWSSPFVADVFPTSSFQITSGPGGGPCPSNPMPFSPSLTAGSTTDQAGGFTNFSLLLQRGDGQQRIERLQFREPAGLAGMISSVPLCPEPQASKGECPDASKIGHAAVASGPGPYPLTIPQPGNPESPIYLTGPYGGAPFGLSIVTHVIAGPFNLGTIITRAKIEIDPTTAQITVTTDPFPQVVAGVPTDLRLINSVIDRPNFLFNPTNCSPQEFTGTAWGTPPPGAGGPGATAAISSHFGVGSCRELAFTPQTAVSTAARSSKANGASLFFKIAYPKGAQGKQSWFSEAKFDLPKQLPARLTTLQKACLASVFETNPASCPPASLIGHAIVHTPVLPVPLAGPVYFVSHGGAKFPDAVIVLQGDGVTVDLTGETFINGKTGITSATFRNTPDVPFENIEVSIPTGPFSEFGANLPAKAKGSFCGQKLVMPTLFKAQNGLEIHQNTAIGVTGCPPTVTITKTKLTGNTLLVTVRTSAKGTVRISGNGLKTTVKKNLKAGTYQIRVALTKTGTSMRAHHKKTTVRAGLTVGKQVVAKTTAVRL